MLKKLLLSLLLLILTSPFAFALSYKGEHQYISKAPYKGDSTPPPTAEAIPCLTYTFDPGFYLGLNPGINTNYTQKGSSIYKAFQGTIFAGYAMIRSNFYLGAELFMNRDVELQNYPNNINANGNSIGLKSTYGGGFSLLPGLILADTVMAYLRLGAIITHFQEVAETETGGQVGLGLQVAVSQSWNVRCEYTYSFYPALTGLGSARSDTYRIGLVYKI